jgi:hypothetical protein
MSEADGSVGATVRRHVGVFPDADYPGRELLGVGSPAEVMTRILQGDPLEIRARCRERLEEEALLLSLHRLHLRALARAAHGAPRYRGSPPLAVWLRTCIDRSIDDLLDEDRDEERSFSLTDGELEHPYAFIADLLQCEPELARSACVAFNALPREDRRTFFAIVIERTPLVRFVAQGNGPPMKVKESLRRAFRALGLADEPWSSSEGADG